MEACLGGIGWHGEAQVSPDTMQCPTACDLAFLRNLQQLTFKIDLLN
jgi:hypothetical protein